MVPAVPRRRSWSPSSSKLPVRRLQPPQPEIRGVSPAKIRCGSRCCWPPAPACRSSAPASSRATQGAVDQRIATALARPDVDEAFHHQGESWRLVGLHGRARRNQPFQAHQLRLARLPAFLQLCGLECLVVGLHRHRQPPAVGAQGDRRGIGHSEEQSADRPGLRAGEQAVDLGRRQVEEPERHHLLPGGAHDQRQRVQRRPPIRHRDGQAHGGARSQLAV